MSGLLRGKAGPRGEEGTRRGALVPQRVWADAEPPDRLSGMVFPGVQEATWTYDEAAGAWFHHRFYDFEPDLDIGFPAVRQEIRKIVSFWQRLGVSGFRVDAAPFAIERTEPGREVGTRDYGFLTELREHLSWHGGDAVFLAEANVENGDLLEFFGSADGAANRLQMLFAFGLNEAIMLSLARQDCRPVAGALRVLPDLPRHGQWATFLRNHDEVDLSGLSPEDRQAVFDAFGPDDEHRLYGWGIRRRLAPMLDGDQRRLRLAYSSSSPCPGRP
jgi:maltose alpha-D-glucosyltransferase / alpha-amylase